jgi:hypothetical protein
VQSVKLGYDNNHWLIGHTYQIKQDESIIRMSIRDSRVGGRHIRSMFPRKPCVSHNENSIICVNILRDISLNVVHYLESLGERFINRLDCGVAWKACDDNITIGGQLLWTQRNRDLLLSEFISQRLSLSDGTVIDEDGRDV